MKRPVMREAVLIAGEEFCCDPDPDSSVGVVCTRPAGHRGKHAAHGDNPDVPLWTWQRAPASPSEHGGGDGACEACAREKREGATFHGEHTCGTGQAPGGKRT